MKLRTLVLAVTMPLTIALVAGCSSTNPITDSLNIGYGQISIVSQKQDNSFVVSADVTVRLANRSEHGMNIAFLEGTIYDDATKKALVRFRPIIPDSYGSTSTAQLYAKQTRDFKVVTPLDLPGFDPAVSPVVRVKLAFQTTDGYRSEVVSDSVAVHSK